MRIRISTRPVIACIALVLSVLPAMAQNLYAPAARVNDSVVTAYELDQRIKFLRVLNQPGNIEQLALDGLIDDRLRTQAAKALGVAVSDEQIAAGMEEFAGRAELTTEQFLLAIGETGVEAQAFRDFVRAGLAWREVIGSRFGPRTQITEAEIDRALALSSSQGGVRVLLSEIILPAPPDQLEAARSRASEIAEIDTLAGFAEAARSYSAAPSRAQDGRLEWVPVGNLPPPIRAQILTLRPGQVTAPIEGNNAIVLFQLRAMEETGAPRVETLSVDYASYYLPGGQDAQPMANRIRNQVDTCDDLYGVAMDQPEEVLDRDTLPVAEVPQDIALELAKLDENEISTALTRNSGETLVLLMLCGRVTEQTAEVPREDIRAQLANQRLGSFADSYLAELRADATIIFP